jgi:hypothetical protein
MRCSRLCFVVRGARRLDVLALAALVRFDAIGTKIVEMKTHALAEPPLL